jgi:sporulation protein YlmC with PRC-barrel domain
MMAVREIRLELLLGRQVFALNGKSVGRIEEICAEKQSHGTVVTNFHIGAFAAFERLSAWGIGRAILDLLYLRKKSGGYAVPWNRLDLSDPARPRLTCSVEELPALNAGAALRA